VHGGTTRSPWQKHNQNSSSPARSSRDGYTVLSWRGPDFRFSAVSGVAAGELAGFVEKLRRVMAAP
jgi:hypothetical protein